MLRLMLVLFIFSSTVPLIACAEQPTRVPILSDPGKTKTCPRGQTTC